MGVDGSRRQWVATDGSGRRQDAPPMSRRLTSDCPTVPPKIPRGLLRFPEGFHRVTKVPRGLLRFLRGFGRGGGQKSDNYLKQGWERMRWAAGRAGHDGSSTGQLAERAGCDQTLAA